MDPQNPYRPPPAEPPKSALDGDGKTTWQLRVVKALLPGIAAVAFLGGYFMIANPYGDSYVTYVGLGMLLSPIAIYILAAAIQ